MNISRSFFIWVFLLFSVTWFFGYLLDNLNNPNQKIIEIVNEKGNREVVLQRNYRGHYVANGKINDKNVIFFLDSGATAIGVPEKVARDLHLKQGAPVMVSTANGSASAYATRLATVTIGNIAIEDVSALIIPNMQGDHVLLGMSFLKHLELVQIGDTLTLKIPEQYYD